MKSGCVACKKKNNSTSTCRWRGVKRRASSCHADCHFDSNALGRHQERKKKMHAAGALMTVAVLCFACYTNVPPAFLLCSNENCRAVSTLLVLLFPHFLGFVFFPSACTLFTLELTKKRRGEEGGLACRKRPTAAHQERQMQTH